MFSGAVLEDVDLVAEDGESALPPPDVGSWPLQADSNTAALVRSRSCIRTYFWLRLMVTPKLVFVSRNPHLRRPTEGSRRPGLSGGVTYCDHFNPRKCRGYPLAGPEVRESRRHRVSVQIDRSRPVKFFTAQTQPHGWIVSESDRRLDEHGSREEPGKTGSQGILLTLRSRLCGHRKEFGAPLLSIDQPPL